MVVSCNKCFLSGNMYSGRFFGILLKMVCFKELVCGNFP